MRLALSKKLCNTPILWRYNRQITDICCEAYWPLRRLIVPSPFLGDKKMIVHCSYHKAGSTWFRNVLSDFADYYGLSYRNYKQLGRNRYTDICMTNDSMNPATLVNYVGTHMLRDPRDLTISGYHYHKWTSEEWVHVPNSEYGGKTRQEYLNSVSMEEALFAEIKGLGKTISRMAEWDYNNPNVLEFKYEEIIDYQEEVFRRIFIKYGLTDDAIEVAMNFVERHSFKKKAGRNLGEITEKSHLRSGRSGEWQKFYNSEHKAFFKELYGDVLVKIGYEDNNDW